MRHHKYLFIITILYFLLGLINIVFSLLGLVCLFLPFILLIKNKKKTWCQGYCPRAGLYTTLGKLKKNNLRKTPRFFITGDMKWVMVFYFALSLSFITMTTLKVANGSMPSMDYLRFLIFIKVPGELPQLLDFNSVTSWVIHLSYRFYSLMMTTTVLGLIVAFMYKPRTWCTICPIATLSDIALKNK